MEQSKAFVNEVIKTVNESPILQPTSKVQLDNTDTTLDNPTLEPVTVILEQEEQHEQINVLNRSSTVHIHDRLIDKLQNNYQCIPCDTPTENHCKYNSSQSLQQLKLRTTIEDTIYTKPFMNLFVIPGHAYCMFMDLGANWSATRHK